MITKDDVLDAERAAEAARERARQMRDDFAAQECPLRVGDLVNCTGFSHKGKTFRVSQIWAPRYEWDGNWRASGPLLRKDGSEGERHGETTQREYEEAMRKLAPKQGPTNDHP